MTTLSARTTAPSWDRAVYRAWGRNIREARGKFWTQQGLAEVVGITAGALSNIESGRRCPTDSVKWRIAGALRRPVGEIFPWPAEIPPFPKNLLQKADAASRAAVVA